MERLLGQVDHHHKKKCRICCQDFAPSDEFVGISIAVQERFLTVTQTQLPMSGDFSSKICSICDAQLIEFCSVRESMIGMQENLAAFAIQQKVDQETGTSLLEGTDHSYIFVDVSEASTNQQNSTGTDQAERRLQQKPTTASITPNMFHCDLCGLSSRSKVYFSLHMKRHESSSVSSNYCRTCHKIFETQSLLSQHRSKVHKAKVHLCDSCGKGFNGPSALEVHRKSQHAERELPCHYCGKLFASQRHLKKHLKYHEGVKFACDFEGCGKEFILNSLLIEHSKTHSDIKDFRCDVCSKSFFLQRQLRKHLNGVHSTRSFGCELCAYSNGRRDNLRTHYFRSHNLTKDEVDGFLARGFE